ncbi:MAG: hypothetical protein GY795_15790 [Desulfobacterales bacterium]|nr:hypothetical protein [Desulfobacterales bacterium]
MKNEAMEALNKFGEALLKGTSDAIGAICASWLQGEPIENFLQSMQKKEADIRREFSDVTIGEAESYGIDVNNCTVDDLREDHVVFSDQINDSNFVQWACVTIQADDGEWSLGDAWCAVVREGEEYKIGYFEVGDPD